MATVEDFKEIAVVAQTRRQAGIPTEYLLPPTKLEALTGSINVINAVRESGQLSSKEVEIVHLEPNALLMNISSRTITSVEVARAFCKAAVIAQQLTNCLTEIIFAEALQRASELDRYLERTGQTVGPLHGLPISLKDCFNVPPHPSSVGMAHYANTPKQTLEESTIVATLKRLGAVIYVKTNVPVAMMMPETINNVWGETVNPWHSGLSAGGSSGGEAALIAMRGSPIGVGTDIGGSIRIPAAFCGLYGLKGSYGRFPPGSVASAIPGQEFVPSIQGPMARTLDALELYCSSVLSAHPAASPWEYDPKCLPIPWRTGTQIESPGRKLRFGLVGPAHDGAVHVHPPIERALKVTLSALETAGHSIIDWPAPKHDEMLKLVTQGFRAFGSNAIHEILAAHNEPYFGYMDGYRDRAAQIAQDKAAGDTSNIFDGDKLRHMTLARNQLAQEYLKRWQEEKLDGIIIAVSPWCAARRGVTSRRDQKTRYIGYTAWVNLLDLPSCTFPVTRADAKLDLRRTDFAPLSEEDALHQADYDPAFYHGAPVSLQLVGPRLQEEKLLEMVKVVRGALNDTLVS